MEQVKTTPEEQLPRFSIVLETENLANADLNGLSESLASLAAQDVSPTCAQEVWLIDSGDTPLDLLQELRDRYAWIKVYSAPLGTGYYEAKMLGAKQSTGEVVVYFDSDCVYESHWLRSILSPFVRDTTIQVVAGETMTRGLGIYGTAMVMAYIFPPFSGQTTLMKTEGYFLNNVAFRRDFLLANPIPNELPLYRGNCAIHAQNLLRSGYSIWQQPQARATHAPPSSVAHFFWRFLLIGHDYYWQQRIASEAPMPQQDAMSGFGGKLQVFVDRFRKMLACEPRHLIYIPLALPFALGSVVLVAVGYAIAALKPNYLLTAYNNVLGEV
ncbi:glycosyltransferase [Lusitaniella coriacea]|uniref:glycosyltransferase n=1 Tax=Lusitaniella coriacea TaxID=1983105 RepID=UPI003CEA333E